jgi:hypothetical protein
MNNKERRWQEVYAHYSQMADKTGRGIDAGILETVVVLNLLGIETTASCEGHLERGQAAPWIDIEARSAQEETRQVIYLFTHARKELEKKHLPEDEINALFAQAHQEQNRVRSIHLAQREKLMCCLTAFYQEHQAPYDHLLVVHPRDTTGRARMESHGASMVNEYDRKERQEKLVSYQQEMAAFTSFLKKKYFQV